MRLDPLLYVLQWGLLPPFAKCKIQSRIQPSTTSHCHKCRPPGSETSQTSVALKSNLTLTSPHIIF